MAVDGANFQFGGDLRPLLDNIKQLAVGLQATAVQSKTFESSLTKVNASLEVIRTTLKGSLSSLQAFLTQFRQSDFVKAAVDKMVAGFQILQKMLVQVGTATATLFKNGVQAVEPYIAKLKELSTVYGGFDPPIRRATVATEGFSTAVEKAQIKSTILGSILATAVLTGVERLAQAIANKLSPDFSALTTIIEHDSEALVNLQAKTVLFANAFEKGRREALAPFLDFLTNIRAAFIPVNEQFVEATGAVAGWLATIASGTAKAAGFLSTVTLIGGVVGGLRTVLDIKPVQAWLTKVLDAGQAVDSFGKLASGAGSLIKKGLLSVLADTLEILRAMLPTFTRVGQAAVYFFTNLTPTGKILTLIAVLGTLSVTVLGIKEAFASTDEEVSKTASAFERLRVANSSLANQIEGTLGNLNRQLKQLSVTQAQLANDPRANLLTAQFGTREEFDQFKQGIEELRKQWSAIPELTDEVRESLSKQVGQLERIGTAQFQYIKAQREANANLQIQLDSIDHIAERQRQAVDGQMQALATRREQNAAEQQALSLALDSEAKQQRQVDLQIQAGDLAKEGLTLQARVAAVEREAAVARANAYTRERQQLQANVASVESVEQIYQRQTQQLDELNKKLRIQEEIYAKVKATVSRFANLSEQEAIIGSLRTEIQARERIVEQTRQIVKAEENRLSAAEMFRREEEAARAAAESLGKQIGVIGAQQETITKLQVEQRKNLSGQLQSYQTLLSLNAALVQRAAERRDLEASTTELDKVRLENQLLLVQADEDTYANRARILQLQQRIAAVDERLLELAREKLDEERDLLIAREDILKQQLDTLEAQGRETEAYRATANQIAEIRARLALIPAELQRNVLEAERLRGQVSLIQRDMERLNQVPFNWGTVIQQAVNDGFDAVVLGTRKMSDVFEGMKASVLRTYANMFSEMIARKLKFDTIWQSNWLNDIPSAVAGGVNKAIGFVKGLFGGGGSAGGGGGLFGLFGGGGGGGTGAGGGGGLGGILGLLSGGGGAGSAGLSGAGAFGVPGIYSPPTSLQGVDFGAGPIGGNSFGGNVLGAVPGLFSVGKSIFGGGQTGSRVVNGIFGALGVIAAFIPGLQLLAPILPLIGGLLGGLFKPGRIATEKKDIEKYLEGSFGFNIPRKNLDKFLPGGRENFGEFRPALTALGADFTIQQSKGGIGTLKRFANLATGGFEEANLTDDEAKTKILELARAVGFDLTKAFKDLNIALNDGFKDKNNRLTLKEYNEEVKEGQKDITSYGDVLKGTFEIVSEFSDQIDAGALSQRLLAERFREVAKAGGDFNADMEGVADAVQKGTLKIEEAINQLNAYRAAQGKTGLELKDFEVSVEKARLEFLKFGIAVDETSNKALGFISTLDQIDAALKQIQDQSKAARQAIRDFDAQVRQSKFDISARFAGLEGERPSRTLQNFRTQILDPEFKKLTGKGFTESQSISRKTLRGLDDNELSRLGANVDQRVESFFASFEARVQERQGALQRRLEIESGRLNSSAEKRLKALNNEYEAAQKAARARSEGLQKEAELISENTQKQLEGLRKTLDAARAFEALGKQLKQNITGLLLSNASPFGPAEQIGLAQREVSSLRAKFQGASDPLKRAQALSDLTAGLNQLLTQQQTLSQRADPNYQEFFRGIIRELEALQKEATTKGTPADSIEAQMKALQEQANQHLKQINRAAEDQSRKLEQLRESNELKADAIRVQLEKDQKALAKKYEDEFEKFRQQRLKILKQQLDHAEKIKDDINKEARRRAIEQLHELREQERELKKYRTSVENKLQTLLNITHGELAQLLKDIRDNTKNASLGVDIAAAEGFRGIVSQPTRILAGERYQPEMIHIEPLRGRSSFGDQQPMSLVVNSSIVVNMPKGAQYDEQQLADRLASRAADKIEDVMMKRLRTGRLGQVSRQVTQRKAA